MRVCGTRNTRDLAKVVNSKPDFECMVEGHTDNVPYQSGVLLDNWDLSVKRSTSIIRVVFLLIRFFISVARLHQIYAQKEEENDFKTDFTSKPIAETGNQNNLEIAH